MYPFCEKTNKAPPFPAGLNLKLKTYNSKPSTSLRTSSLRTAVQTLITSSGSHHDMPAVTA